MSDKEISTTSGGATNGSDSLASRLLRRLPGGSFAQEQFDRIEQRVLGELKQRLDRIDRRSAVSVLAFAVESTSKKRGAGPGELLRELLDLASEQTQQQAEQAYYMAALKSMVPDEARILSALSDGSTYPVVHVMAGGRLGLSWHPVMEYVSSVGRNAGIIWPDMGYAYVQHLRSLNLVDTGPEDYTQTTKYEVLETEQVVRAALEQIKQSGQRSHITRRVLRMSDLGNRLWAACRVSED